MARPPQAQPALIFIPDITGFTKFVTETELVHSQHIITELLETLMDSNNTGLEVSEIEGDAILYYRFGEEANAENILNQVQEMFIRFHEHLVRYNNRRICQCGACKTANSLTLKFVVHYGSIALNQVGSHTKLFGKEVIVAHRLLKNEIPHHEYALFTHPLLEACETWNKADEFAWAKFDTGKEVYDSGPVQFDYLALAPLKKKLKPIENLPPIMTGRPIKAIELEQSFNVPIEILLSRIVDLDFRPKWSGIGIKKITPHELNRQGTVHQCLIPNSKDRPEFITENFKRENNKFSFDETEVNGRFSNRWILENKGAEKTFLKTQVWIKNNFLFKILFYLFFRSKLKKNARENLQKLEMLLLEEYKKNGKWQKGLVL